MMKKNNKKDIDSIIDYVSSNELVKLYSRNSSLQMNELFVFYIILEMNKLMKINFCQFSFDKREFTDCYTSKEEFEEVKKNIRTKIEKCRSIKDLFESDALPSFERYLKFTKKMNEKYKNGEKSNKIIGDDYEKFLKINANFVAHLFFIFLADTVIDEMIKDSLSAYLKKINEEDCFKKYLIIISTPIKKSAVINENKELLKLASIKNDKNISKLLAEHAKKWGWFPCFNPFDTPYSQKHFENELKQYTAKNARKELEEINRSEKKHQSEYKKFLGSIKNAELKKLILLVNSISFYREYRNDIRREGLSLIKPLYEKIAEKFGLNIKETCYLTAQETIDSLKSGKLVVPRKKISKRIEKNILFYDGEKEIIIDGKKEIEKIEKAIKDKEKKENISKGFPASGGLAKGRAYIISNINKLNSFRKGDILVASMTAPDYIQAMRKAAAIVTDEGGITCHAAIVSRELKIPCIIGTKIATKVLKDGDLVEVDADKGVVKIIKKA